MPDRPPRARQPLVGIFHRHDEALPGRRLTVAEPPRNQRAVFCQQLIDRRRDMFGFDLREARQTGEVEQWICHVFSWEINSRCLPAMLRWLRNRIVHIIALPRHADVDKYASVSFSEAQKKGCPKTPAGR